MSCPFRQSKNLLRGEGVKEEDDCIDLFVYLYLSSLVQIHKCSIPTARGLKLCTWVNKGQIEKTKITCLVCFLLDISLLSSISAHVSELVTLPTISCIHFSVFHLFEHEQ